MSKITANMICEALKNTYQPPEWYLGFEVGNNTGSNCRRHADAVAVNAYPSKGFEARGFEIKVSKSDLKSELENGEKSDVIARFCDYWFLVVPKGLADEFTLPPTWGVIEYLDGKLRQKAKATKLEKGETTSGFMCAMLRGRERLLLQRTNRLTAEREEQIKRETMWRAGNAEKELKELREKLKEIKDSTGIALDRWNPTKEIVHRLNAAQSLEIITRNVRFIERCAEDLAKGAQEIKTASDAILAGEAALQEKGAAR